MVIMPAPAPAQHAVHCMSVLPRMYWALNDSPVYKG